MFDDWYRDFASTVSYYDFRSPEYERIELDEPSTRGLAALRNLPKIDQETLTRVLQSEPAVLFGLERFFRDTRFRNGQWIYFLFDVSILNRPADSSVWEYVRANLRYDDALREICASRTDDARLAGQVRSLELPQDRSTQLQVISAFKKSLVPFIRKEKAVRARLASDHSAPDRQRIARYLVERLGLPDIMKSVDVTAFPTWKLHPADIRTTHGEFGQERVREVLQRRGFVDVTSSRAELGFKPQSKIDDVRTKADKEKMFDFLLFRDDRLVAALETNFYESEGSKIGINVEEYLELSQEVQRRSAAKFLWITDGSHWLTTDGCNTLRQLHAAFEGRVYNYNTFDRELPSIVLSW